MALLQLHDRRPVEPLLLGLAGAQGFSDRIGDFGRNLDAAYDFLSQASSALVPLLLAHANSD
ncbi:MAG: hypothetical protein LC791_08810, partial [Acidobacteria bacterium]|nr:hypothetical protein [Acidobacteriota bacterium]